jgi:undecaprenyl-phosphate galactose phosphotransferase
MSFRMLARKGLQALNVWSVSAIMIGNGQTAEEARNVLGSDKNLGYKIVAQFGDLNFIQKQTNFSWAELCARHKAEHVIVAVDAKDMVQAQNALSQLMREHVEFSIVPPTQSFPVVGVTPQFFLGQDVMLMNRSNGLEYPLPRLLKRLFDILISVTALIVASPIIGLLALIVKRDGGKAFYGHKRIGLNGKAFYCLKLRSMVMNSNEALTAYLANNPEAQIEWARDHKLKNDPRVTAIGNFMRRTSLDELPQLINVLRPIVVAETEKYDNDIAYYYRVRPGVTGLWQVSGRSDVSYAERVRMDSWYVRNWSFWNDIAIICKTFSVVLKGRGAC